MDVWRCPWGAQLLLDDPDGLASAILLGAGMEPLSGALGSGDRRAARGSRNGRYRTDGVISSGRGLARKLRVV